MVRTPAPQPSPTSLHPSHIQHNACHRQQDVRNGLVSLLSLSGSFTRLLLHTHHNSCLCCTAQSPSVTLSPCMLPPAAWRSWEGMGERGCMRGLGCRLGWCSRMLIDGTEGERQGLVIRVLRSFFLGSREQMPLSLLHFVLLCLCCGRGRGGSSEEWEGSKSAEGDRVAHRVTPCLPF